MSMADDNTVRSYRSNDPYRRSANQADARDNAASGTDPLAELARLIGRPDPFHEPVRRQPEAAAQYVDDAGEWQRQVQRPSYDQRQDYDEAAYDADPRYAPEEPGHDAYAMAAHRDDRYADPHADHRYDADDAAGYSGQQDYPGQQMYADAPHRAAYAGDVHHGGMKLPNDDDYDDPPRRRRSGSSLVTAVVLIGCAMLGTAGAYGYRTYSSGSAGSGQAPVIIADSAPNKIVPNTEQKTARSQDRIGQGDERLVSREEQPVALQAPGTSSSPRVVSPWPVQPSPTTTGSTPAASGDEPKRVRTVPIRPDGGDVSGRPTGEASSRSAPPSTRTAAAPPPNRQARDVPLSLDPGAPAQSAEPAPVRPQPAARVASAPSNGGVAGGYLVQVSSQRSESDAQASYRGLQAKYSQLKSRQAIIRRADLGSKGVYYRAMVGPFESSDEAGQFCSGLKQAGGQCIILRN